MRIYQKSVGRICVGLFLSSLFCCIELCVYTSANITVLIPMSLEFGWTDSFRFLLPFQNYFSDSTSFPFLYKF